MKSKITNTHLIIRIDKGENLVESLNAACNEHKVISASISGIGATDYFKCGVFNLQTKEYKELEFSGTYEILALCGNITQKDCKTYFHAHITVGDENGHSFGGHLIEARISATCEIVLDLIECQIERRLDQVSGLNLLDL